MEKTCVLQCKEFPADTIVLGVQEQINRRGCQEKICSSVWRDDTIGVMKMHALKSKLGRVAVGVGLGILIGPETK